MTLTPPVQRRRFVFISSNPTPWGGSEELWATTAATLARDGHDVTVLKLLVDETQPRIQQLRAAGCRVRDLIRIPFLPRIVSRILRRLVYPAMLAQEVARTWLGVALARPDLVVVSQGGNIDGALVAEICRRRKQPYVLIAQKATELYWPLDSRLDRLRRTYTAAERSFFVSEHNRRLTEEQLGLALPRAAVVRNPFLVPYELRADWPDEQHGLRLACIGRMYPAEKGQDLLLRVLSRERWRGRALSVTFYGEGGHTQALEATAAHYGLTSVRFAGFAADVPAIWAGHHGLVLPTRSEGLPLVLVEAMLSGRVPIVTNVGGNAEVVTDNDTGFLAATASEDAIDEALDRAWQRREEWRTIGARAADHIRTLVPPDPPRVFADELLRIAEETTKGLRRAGTAGSV